MDASAASDQHNGQDRLLEGGALLDLQEQGYKCMDGLLTTIEGSGIDMECASSLRAHLHTGPGVCICICASASFRIC